MFTRSGITGRAGTGVRELRVVWPTIGPAGEGSAKETPDGVLPGKARRKVATLTECVFVCVWVSYAVRIVLYSVFYLCARAHTRARARVAKTTANFAEQRDKT